MLSIKSYLEKISWWNLLERVEQLIWLEISFRLRQPILLQADTGGDVWWIPLLMKESPQKLTSIKVGT